MSRKCWNGTLAGEYLCIRSFSTYYASGSQSKLQELEVGELYQNLNLDLKSRNFVQNRVGHLLESKWFAALQSILTDSEAGPVTPVTLEGGQIVIREDRFERCLYGPLTTGELGEYSLITTKEKRFERFLSLWADYVRSLNIGDPVHMWYNDKKVSGSFRCKSLFFDVPFPQGVTKPDMWIGIELSEKFIGKGNSDGTFNGVRYFSCAENGALFLSYEAIAWNCVKCTCGDSAKYHQCSIVVEAVKTIDNMVRMLQRDKFLLKPKRKLTVEKLEDHLDQELPYEHTALVIGVSVAQSLIDEYGLAKHLQNVEVSRNLPGVRLLRQLTAPNDYVVIVGPKEAQQARESLELFQVHIKVAPRHSDNFRKAGSSVLKAMKEISGCGVKLHEKKGGFEITLTGLQSEIHAARLVLDEELGALETKQKGGKAKSKKKKQKPMAAVTDSVSVVGTASKPETGKREMTLLESMEKTDDDVAETKLRLTSENGTVQAEDVLENVAGDFKRDATSEEQRIVDCVVCLSERATAAFIPCGHMHTCPACAEKVFQSNSPQCPTCRGEIKHYCRIWI